MVRVKERQEDNSSKKSMTWQSTSSLISFSFAGLWARMASKVSWQESDFVKRLHWAGSSLALALPDSRRRLATSIAEMYYYNTHRTARISPDCPHYPVQYNLCIFIARFMIRLCQNTIKHGIYVAHFTCECARVRQFPYS